MTTFFYFAYGSNMLTQRLQARCPSAAPVGPARVSGFGIAMKKKSKDGSGKATLAPAFRGISQDTFGVVFEIPENERQLLDHAEGYGYIRDDAYSVTLTRSDRRFTTSTYLAADDHIATNLYPFCWYRALIIAGAEQHRLPQDYVADLRAQAFQPDPDPHRASRKEAIGVLEAAGFAHLLP